MPVRCAPAVLQHALSGQSGPANHCQQLVITVLLPTPPPAPCSRTEVEARQVAELLSQLPSEMDVEALVSQAFNQAEAQAAAEDAAGGRVEGVAKR